MNALDVLCAQLMRDLFAIAKFLLKFMCVNVTYRMELRVRQLMVYPLQSTPVSSVPLMSQ